MNNKRFYTITGMVLLISALFWVLMFQPGSQEGAVSQSFEQYDGEITLTMYHGEGCACCVRWAEYLEGHGVTVKDVLLDDPHSVKNENNVPPRLRSCHTAIVDGYVIEGHVPIEDIRRLLAERPDAIGISVPGMPPNAPGMDQPVDREYQSVIFDAENMAVYNIHR
jgi:hypothetical protein